MDVLARVLADDLVTLGIRRIGLRRKIRGRKDDARRRPDLAMGIDRAVPVTCRKVSSHSTGGVSQKHGPPAGSMVQTSPAIGHCPSHVAGSLRSQATGGVSQKQGPPAGSMVQTSPAIGHGPSQVKGSLRSQSTTSGMHSQISGWIGRSSMRPGPFVWGSKGPPLTESSVKTSKKLSICHRPPPRSVIVVWPGEGKLRTLTNLDGYAAGIPREGHRRGSRSGRFRSCCRPCRASRSSPAP